MSGTPPGWYPDAQGTTRWFDGAAWTEHTQPAVPPTPSASPYAPDPGSGPGSGPGSSSGSGSAPDEPPAWTPMSPMPPSAPPSTGPWTGPATGGTGATGVVGAQPRRDRGLLVGLGVLSLALLVGIVVVAVLLLTRGGSDPAAASDPSTTSLPTTSGGSSGGSSGGTSGSAAPSPLPTSTPSSSPAGPPTAHATSRPPATSGGGGSPEAVTKGFFKALLQGDCVTAETYVDPSAVGAAGACASAALPSTTLDSVKLRVGTAKIDGDNAAVKVTLVPDLPGVDASTYATTLTSTLRRSGGAWRLTAVS